MFYREVGDLKTSYRSDQAVLTITQERWAVLALVAFMYMAVPFIADDFWLNTVIIPTLIFALAALGLNLLVGYAGLISLGTGGFMGVGAYACYKLTSI
jgi:branched-chain amino acid transport system permease protein